MTISASIKFTQNAVVGTAGIAFMGNTGQAVTCANGDNTNVVQWKWEVLAVPPGSAVPTGVVQNGTTPTYTFTPDSRGGYLLRLTTFDALGNAVVSVPLCFGITETSGRFIPPFGAIAASLNFSGNALGWAYYLRQYLVAVDTGAGGGGGGGGGTLYGDFVGSTSEAQQFAMTGIRVKANADAAVSGGGAVLTRDVGTSAKLQEIHYDPSTGSTPLWGPVLWILSPGHNAVFRYDLHSATLIGISLAGYCPSGTAISMCVGTGNKIYVLCAGISGFNPTILKIDGTPVAGTNADGVMSIVGVTGTISLAADPTIAANGLVVTSSSYSSIAYDATNAKLWVTNGSTSLDANIYKVDPTSGTITPIALSMATGPLFIANGFAWAASTVNGAAGSATVYRVDLVSSAVTTIAVTGATAPLSWITYDSTDNLVFGGTGTADSTLYRINGSTFAVTACTAAEPQNDSGFYDPVSHILFVWDSAHKYLVPYSNLATTPSVVGGTFITDFSTVSGIAIPPGSPSACNSNLAVVGNGLGNDGWVLDYHNAQVIAFDASGGGNQSFQCGIGGVAKWIASSTSTLAGDVTGSVGSNTVGKINGATAPSSPTGGDINKSITVTGAGAYGLVDVRGCALQSFGTAKGSANTINFRGSASVEQPSVSGGIGSVYLMRQPAGRDLLEAKHPKFRWMSRYQGLEQVTTGITGSDVVATDKYIAVLDSTSTQPIKLVDPVTGVLVAAMPTTPLATSGWSSVTYVRADQQTGQAPAAGYLYLTKTGTNQCVRINVETGASDAITAPSASGNSRFFQRDSGSLYQVSGGTLYTLSLPCGTSVPTYTSTTVTGLDTDERAQIAFTKEQLAEGTTAYHLWLTQPTAGTLLKIAYSSGTTWALANTYSYNVAATYTKPVQLAFDGAYLWVGVCEFSGNTGAMVRVNPLDGTQQGYVTPGPDTTGRVHFDGKVVVWSRPGQNGSSNTDSLHYLFPDRRTSDFTAGSPDGGLRPANPGAIASNPFGVPWHSIFVLDGSNNLYRYSDRPSLNLRSLSISGAFVDHVRSTVSAASFTVSGDDSVIPVDSTSNTVLVYLPASARIGHRVTIKDVSGKSYVNAITVSGNGGTIDGATGYVINSAYGWVVVEATGTSTWMIVSVGAEGSSSQISRSPVATSAAFLHWGCDDAFGSTSLANSTGVANGSLSTLSGTPVLDRTGILGGAVKFGGTAYARNGAGAVNPTSNAQLTIHGWVKMKSGNTTNPGYLITKGLNTTYSGAAPDSFAIILDKTNTGNLYVAAESGGVVKQTDNTQVTDAIAADGQWHHVAVTFNGGVVNIYLDGNLILTDNSTLASTIDWNGASGGYWYLGGNPTGGVIGDLDDWWVLDGTVLTKAQVRSIFQVGRYGSTS